VRHASYVTLQKPISVFESTSSLNLANLFLLGVARQFLLFIDSLSNYRTVNIFQE
jgi:hypothetical protein